LFQLLFVPYNNLFLVLAVGESELINLFTIQKEDKLNFYGTMGNTHEKPQDEELLRSIKYDIGQTSDIPVEKQDVETDTTSGQPKTEDVETKRDNVSSSISMKKMISNQQKKTNLKNAKKINSRVNRKRKRGPEPSNSALYYYRMDVLEEVAEKYPNASPSDIVEVVQNQWEKLDKKAKEQYFRLAQMDQQRFDEEAKQYIPRSEGGTMKRPKRKKHPNAPKHPMSAYLYFASDHREKAKAENPDKDFTEIARILGAMWKTFDPEKKKEYEQRAEADKARYRKEKLAFEPCPLVVDNKKRKKHPLAPKHPLSGYLYFVANNRANFNKRYPDKDFTEVAKLLGEKWKNLDAKEKRKYQILAAADKKRYEEEKQKWQPPIEREIDTNYVVMPKKPMTAYSYWVYNQRSKITQSNPYVDKKELTRVLREKWNKIPEREKAFFNEKAELDRQRYQRELSMLPRNYRTNYTYTKLQRHDRLMRVSQEVLRWTPDDIRNALQICGISYESASKFRFLNVSGTDFVALTASKLRNTIDINDYAEVRRICRIIWILSM